MMDEVTQALVTALEQLLDDLSAGTMRWTPTTGVCEAAWDQALAALRQAGWEEEA